MNLNNSLSNLNYLTMSGNALVCGCEAKNTINFIHKYSSKVKIKNCLF